MTLAQLVQYGLSGITVGSIYAITAIGFNIIYSCTGIINFAQGEFLIVGAMTAISLSHVLPLPAAVAVAVLITTLLGGLIELVFIRPARDASVLRLIVHDHRPVHRDPRGHAAPLGREAPVTAVLHRHR